MIYQKQFFIEKKENDYFKVYFIKINLEKK